MQIQLKQLEIIAAIKGYISNQGINLKDKSVDIAFTAGRKEGGLIADIVIEEDKRGTVRSIVPDAVITDPVTVEPDAVPTESETTVAPAPSLFSA
jgi:hypothetical protein